MESDTLGSCLSTWIGKGCQGAGAEAKARARGRFRCGCAKQSHGHLFSSSNNLNPNVHQAADVMASNPVARGYGERASQLERNAATRPKKRLQLIPYPCEVHPHLTAYTLDVLAQTAFLLFHSGGQD